MELDDDRLARALSGVRGIEVGAAGVTAAITEIVSAIPPVLDVGGAGLMIIDGDLSLKAIAWSDEAGRVFETVQEEGGRGPCVQSLLTDTVVAVEDLSIDPRWPDVAQAVGPLGVRGVLGVPVHVDGDNVGAL